VGRCLPQPCPLEGRRATSRTLCRPASTSLSLQFAVRWPSRCALRWTIFDDGHLTRRANRSRERSRRLAKVGGDGGIRTRQDSVDSVSCRLDVASIAVNARVTVAPCTPFEKKKHEKRDHIAAGRSAVAPSRTTSSAERSMFRFVLRGLSRLHRRRAR
jgi:hypothetical protein